MFWIALLIVLSWFVLFATIDFFLQRKRRVYEQNGEVYTISDVTFLIAARNEESKISTCLHSIISSSLEEKRASIIVVDDASEDGTKHVAEQVAKEFPQIDLKILAANGVGKKAALLTGLSEVKTKFIYLVDADCELLPNSLDAALLAVNNTSATVVLGMVKYTYINFFQKLVALEQLNTMAVTHAFANVNKPIMANGGNLLFHTKHINEYRTSLNSEIASGDDMFFLERVLDSSAEITFEEKAIVSTCAPRNLDELIKQRVRWAGKAGSYENLLPKLLPAFVFIVNFSFILLVFFTFYTSTFAFFGLSLIILKTALEYAFHTKWFFRYGQKHRVIDAVLLSAIYPFYVSFVAFLSKAKPSYDWKGRHLKSGRI